MSFGHGLTYTSFELSKLAVAPQPAGGATVSFDVHNTGSRAGTETPQLYLGYPASAGEPPQQLRDFAKVELEAGATISVRFSMPPSKFSIWDDQKHAWKQVAGTFTVTVGTSSRDAAALSTTFVNAGGPAVEGVAAARA